MGHVGLKTRSLSKILEKHCVRSRGNIFTPIITIFFFRIFMLIKSQTYIKLGHVGSKARSLGQMLEKT